MDETESRLQLLRDRLGGDVYNEATWRVSPVTPPADVVVGRALHERLRAMNTRNFSQPFRKAFLETAQEYADATRDEWLAKLTYDAALLNSETARIGLANCQWSARTEPHKALTCLAQATKAVSAAMLEEQVARTALEIAQKKRRDVRARLKIAGDQLDESLASMPFKVDVTYHSTIGDYSTGQGTFRMSGSLPSYAGIIPETAGAYGEAYSILLRATGNGTFTDLPAPEQPCAGRWRGDFDYVLTIHVRSVNERLVEIHPYPHPKAQVEYAGNCPPEVGFHVTFFWILSPPDEQREKLRVRLPQRGGKEVARIELHYGERAAGSDYHATWTVEIG